MENKTVTMAHGAGGKQTSELIDQIFKAHFANKDLTADDAAVLLPPVGKMAVSTDGFIVSPAFSREEILANCLCVERSMILPVWEQDHCILPVHLSLKKDFLWKNWRRSLLPWRKRQKKQAYILCQEIPR